jgi:Na+/H+ antiporter NhaC
MTRLAGLLLTLLAGTGTVPAVSSTGPADLVWHVESTEGAVVASQGADEAVNPASLAKIATSLWALEGLGAGHRFSTLFERQGDDLLVIGSGDPDFQPENAMRAAEGLNRLDVRRIPGRLLVGSSFWIGWERGTNGRAVEPDRRAGLMASRLREALAPRLWSQDIREAWESLARRQGWDPSRPPRVEIDGPAGALTVASGETGGRLLLTHRSRRLPETLRRFNSYSNNDIERLETSLGSPDDLAAFLVRRWQVPPDSIQFATTSGLGRNRLTPRLVVRLLRDLQRTTGALGLRVEEILPVAGCDPGTLEAFPRLTGGPAAGAVAGKTGTLTNTDGGIALLAGFLSTAEGDLLFCVAAPRSGKRLAAARRAEESWLLDLAARHGGARPRECAGPFPLAGDGIVLEPAAAATESDPAPAPGSGAEEPPVAPSGAVENGGAHSGAWSLLPPLLAIALAVGTRQIHLALITGIWLGVTILAGGNPLAGITGTVTTVTSVLLEPSNTRLLIFCLLIGPLVRYMEVFGGVAGFVGWLQGCRLVESARGARMLAWLIGIIVFIETNVTLLVTGAVSRPLFDRYRESREKLAYLADSTSAPVCILIPFNAWGAVILGLLASQDVERPVQVFVQAIPQNYYAIGALLLAGLVAWTGWSPGPMGRAVAARPASPETGGPDDGRPVAPATARARNMVLPLAVMIAVLPFALYVTGDGDIGQGAGSTSALWAVLAGNVLLWLLILGQRLGRPRDLVRHGIRGMGSLVGMVVILLLAITLGEVCSRLGTGLYLAAGLQDVAAPALLVPLTFLIAAAIAFSTGTSWGTFAMIIPVAVPAAVALHLPIAPFLAAGLSGGIFGDHASPVSDTTIVASLAAGTGVVEHVRTQLPYALLAAGGALVAFAITGALL